jgi:hypothetical protein
MKLPDTPNQNSALKKEWRIFSEQSRQIVNAILNRLFDFKPSSAKRRMGSLLLLLILAGFVISLKPYPLSEWGNHLRQLFIYFFTRSDNFATVNINPIFNLIYLGIQAYFNPYTLWYFPAFFVPIYIAYQVASFYLADIFELDHIGIARKFIRQVAFTGSKDVIRITKGDIALEHRDSHIYKIGGPGKVIVDLDSVVLFEKVDGRPNIIGPTGNEPRGKATLDGFERFRQALDLRDHYVDLRDDAGKYSAVRSLSLDGIPVTTTDVRLMFSIYRGNQKPTPEIPYPYTREAIEQQVYRSTSKVTPDLSEPSSFVFVFENSILTMVRRELGRFMSQKNLTEYLASINFPEAKRAEEQENAILDEARLVLEPLESVESVTKQAPSPRSFTPRYEITNLFSQFAKEFTDDARDHGVELQWIGIGTWKVPLELVAEKHLDAWKITRENIGLNSTSAMDNATREAKVQKTVSMIQDVPLGVYPDGISGIPDRNVAFKDLLLEYQRQLKDNFESLRTNKKPFPPTLAAAIFFINRRFGHIVSLTPPPPPATQRERELYEQLRKKIGFFEVVEQLIRFEREINPNASREEVLEKINRDWDLDIAGKWRP